jgi:UDPglucose 6-dehydrogenase
MKLAIIGAGYVGLPTGIGFAELGCDVVCIDKAKEKIDALNAGKVTLFEEGLEELLHKNLASGKIKFTTDTKRGVKNAEIVIIAVGTPPHPVTKEADIKYVLSAAEELAPYLDEYTLICNKSTAPVGTGDKLTELIKSKNPNADFDVVSMPEFLREGFALKDFLKPDRIVIGTDSQRAVKVIERLYGVYPQKPNILYVDRRSAELIKYASNAFLAVKIHYINEMADLCEKVGANVYDVAKGMGLDSRIGKKFLNPGPGYGGSCFPKDTNALAYIGRYNGVHLSLVETAIRENIERMSEMAIRIINAVKNIEDPKIAVWGLAFKGGTDDCRQSPAIKIIQELTSRNINITAFDPKALNSAKEKLGDSINYAKDPISAAKGADVLAVLTEWQEFKDIELENLQMRRKVIIDLRNIIDKEKATDYGYIYQGIGK